MALRSKSQKRLLILAVASVVAIGGGISWYLVRKERIRQYFMAKLPAGMEAYKTGETIQAMNLLGEYLRWDTNSDNQAAHEAYVKVRLRLPEKNQEHLGEVIAQYQQLIALKSDNMDYKFELLKVYGQKGMNTESKQLTELMLKKNNEILNSIAILKGVFAQTGMDPQGLLQAEAKLKKDNVIILQRRAGALRGLGKNEDALEAAKMALELDPLAVVAAQEVLACMQNLGKPGTEMESWGFAQLKGHDGEPGAALIEAMIFGYSAFDSRGEAAIDKVDREIAAMKKVGEETPKNAEYAGYVVELMDSMGLHTEAFDYLEKNRAALNDDKLNDDFYRRLSYKGDFARIDKELSDPARQADKSTLLTALRFVALAELKKEAEARKQLDILKERGRRWDNVAEDWRQVLSMVYFSEVAPANPGDPVIKPRQRDVIETIMDASMRTPDEAYFQYFLGEAYAHSGDAAAAFTRWQNTIKWAPPWARPWMQMATMAEAMNDPESAIAYARKADKLQPNQPEILITLVRAWNAALGKPNATLQMGPREKDGPEEMLKLLERIRKDFPEQEAILPLQVEIEIKLNGNIPRAKQLLAEDSTRKPALSEATLLRLAVISNENKLGMEEQCIAASEKANGVSPQTAWTRAALLKVSDYEGAKKGLAAARTAGLAKSQAEKAPIQAEKAALEKATPKDQKAIDAVDEKLAAVETTIEAWGIAWGRLLEAAQDKEAEKAWQEIAYVPGTSPKELKKDSKVMWALLGAPSLWKDHPFIGQVLDTLKELNGDSGLSYRLERARWLLDDPSHDSQMLAQTLLTETVRTWPTSSAVRELLARAYSNTKNYASAAGQLVAAAELDQKNLALKLQAAQVLLRQGESAPAAGLLDAVANANWATDNQKLRAGVMLAQIPTAAAAEQAMKLLQSTTKDGKTLASTDETGVAPLTVACLYWQMAQLLQVDAVNNYGRADDEFKKLLEKPTADIVEQAAAFYLSVGNVAQAQGAIDKLDSKVDPARRDFIVGRFLAQTDKSKAAVDKLRAAVKQDPSLGEARRWLVVTLITENLIAGKDGAIETAGGVTTELKNLKDAAATLSLKPGVTEKELADATLLVDLMQLVADDPAIKVIAKNSPAVNKLLAEEEGRNYLISCLLTPQDGKVVADVVPIFAAVKLEDHLNDKDVLQGLRIQAMKNPDSLALQILAIRRSVYMNDTDGALRLALHALDTHSNSPILNSYASTCYVILGKLKEAADYAGRWQKYAGKDSTQAELAQVKILVSQQRDKEAQQLLSNHLDDPKIDKSTQSYREMLYLAVSSKAQQRDVKGAAEMLWPHVLVDPKLADAWARIGADVVHPDDDPEGWLKKQEDVTRPDDIEGQMRVGLSAYRLGARLKAPLMLPPDKDKAETQRQRGKVISDHGFAVMEKAVTMYDTPDPDKETQRKHELITSRVALILADACDFSDDLPNAEKYYVLTLKYDPSMHPAYNNLAMILARAKRTPLTEAIDLANKAIALAGNVAAYYDTLAFVLAQDKQFAAAVDALRKAVNLEPTNPLWQINIVDIWVRAGNKQEAEKAMQKLEHDYHFDPSAFPEDMRKRYDDARMKLGRTPG